MVRSKTNMIARCAIGVSVAVLVMTGCSAAEGNDSGGETSQEVLTQSAANVDAAFAASSLLPPSDGPAALPGKKLFYITAGLSSASGTEGVAAVKDATQAMGWDLQIFDGKFSPDKYQEGMRQAISAGADAVLLNAIDCPGNERPLQSLHEAGIKVVAVSSVDCNEGTGGGQSMFDAVPQYPGAATPFEYFEKLGAAQADWIITQSGGKAKVIEFPVPDFLITAATQRGFEARLAECGGCEIVETIPIGIADFGPQIQDKTEQALLKHPDANYIAASYDDLMTYGIASAVKNSGRNDEIGVIAGNGYAPNMDLIRNNMGQDAGFVYDFEWDHFAGVETANRVLDGQPAGVVGPPVVLIDAEHNIGEDGRYIAPVDFRSVFLSSWSR